MKSIKFKVESLRKIPNPYGIFDDNHKKSAEMFIALVDVQNLPDNIPMKTNPREQNLKTKVVTKIEEGLTTNNKSFFLLNRGLLISAKDVKYNNSSSELIILFEDDTVHGNVDGGHTYRTILNHRDDLSPSNQQFVKLEVLTGIEEIFEDVAAARNTSVQVQEKSILELKRKFDLIIKETIVDESFSNNIAYMENEDKDIDISEILTLIHMFNLDSFPDRDKMPVVTFSGKKACINAYTQAYEECENKDGGQENNPYYKMRSVMVDLFKLHDYIETSMERAYRQANVGGKYGAVKGVDIVKNGKTKFKSKFYAHDMDYRSPKGFIYPILGAFRALLEEKNGVYKWKGDPFSYFDEIGKDLVQETVERSRSFGNNPASVGKDPGTWKQLYQNVLTSYLLKNTK